MEEFGAGRVAKETFDAKAAHEFDGAHVMVKNHGAKPGGAHESVDDLTKATDPGDDHRALFVHHIIGAAFATFLDAAGEAIIGDKEQRRDEHGQRHHQHELFGQSRLQHMLLQGEGDQDKAEFPGLCEAEGKEHLIAAAQAKGKAKDEEHQRLDKDQGEGHRQDREGIGEEPGKVDLGADGDKEQAEEQALERLDVAFEFVAEFACGKDHPGKECAECGGEADHHHQQRDADHDQEREGGIHLAQVGGVDKAKQGAHEVAPGEDHGPHGGKGDEGHPPAGQSLNEGKVRGVGLFAAANRLN